MTWAQCWEVRRLVEVTPPLYCPEWNSPPHPRGERTWYLRDLGLGRVDYRCTVLGCPWSVLWHDPARV